MSPKRALRILNGLSSRRCFVCGRFGLCVHREPRVVVAQAERWIDAMRRDVERGKEPKR